MCVWNCACVHGRGTLHGDGGNIAASSSDGKQWSKENIPLATGISCIAGEIDDTGNEITEVLTAKPLR